MSCNLTNKLDFTKNIVYTNNVYNYGLVVKKMFKGIAVDIFDGLVVTLFSMAVVFVVLLAISYIIDLTHLFVKKSN